MSNENDDSPSDDPAGPPGAKHPTIGEDDDPALAELLASPAVWVEPPADLETRTVAAVARAAHRRAPADLGLSDRSTRHVARRGTAIALGRLAGGSYYEGWLEGPAGAPVALGTFNDARDVTLWAGVSPRAFPTLIVTVQGTGVEPSRPGARVLIGKLGARARPGP